MHCGAMSVDGGPVRSAPNRTTADLSSYPGLAVIYPGMRVNAPRGVRTLISFGPKIRQSVETWPDGLLLHESVARFRGGALARPGRGRWSGDGPTMAG